jgi:hypothetical protein
MNGITDVELIARRHIEERVARAPRLPRVRRRVRVAGALRRVADRLDP